MCLFTIPPVSHHRGYEQPDDQSYQQTYLHPFNELPYHKGYDQCRNDGNISSPPHGLKPLFLIQRNNIRHQAVCPGHSRGQFPEEYQSGINEDTLPIPGDHQAAL